MKQVYYKESALTLIQFASIQEVINYIAHTPATSVFQDFLQSDNQSDKWKQFSQTSSLKEAISLLSHGWSCMAETLTKELNVAPRASQSVRKTSYDVAGYQACVPRYLQGIPTSMVQTKTQPIKNKVVTITKSIAYASSVETETIQKESLKVLRLVQSLEAKGYRVRLQVLFAVTKRPGEEKGAICFLFPIKSPSQRLSIKQVAFPLVHPSMLRRICIALIERLSCCAYKELRKGHGYPVVNKKCFVPFLQGTYYIPPILAESEIKDLETYLL